MQICGGNEHDSGNHLYRYRTSSQSVGEYYERIIRVRAKLLVAGAINSPGQISAAGPMMGFVHEVDRLTQHSRELCIHLEFTLTMLRETESRLLTEIPEFRQSPHALQIFIDTVEYMLASLVLGG